MNGSGSHRGVDVDHNRRRNDVGRIEELGGGLEEAGVVQDGIDSGERCFPIDRPVAPEPRHRRVGFLLIVARVLRGRGWQVAGDRWVRPVLLDQRPDRRRVVEHGVDLDRSHQCRHRLQSLGRGHDDPSKHLIVPGESATCRFGRQMTHSESSGEPPNGGGGVHRDGAIAASRLGGEAADQLGRGSRAGRAEAPRRGPGVVRPRCAAPAAQRRAANRSSCDDVTDMPSTAP